MLTSAGAPSGFDSARRCAKKPVAPSDRFHTFEMRGLVPAWNSWRLLRPSLSASSARVRDAVGGLPLIGQAVAVVVGAEARRIRRPQPHRPRRVAQLRVAGAVGDLGGDVILHVRLQRRDVPRVLARRGVDAAGDQRLRATGRDRCRSRTSIVASPPLPLAICRENVPSATFHLMMKNPLPFGSSSAASFTLERRNARCAGASCRSMRKRPISVVSFHNWPLGTGSTSVIGVVERLEIDRVGLREAVRREDVLRDAEVRRGCRPEWFHTRRMMLPPLCALPRIGIQHVPGHELRMIELDRVGEPVIGLRRDLHPVVTGEHHEVVVAVGDAVETELGERRERNLIELAVTEDVLRVGQVPRIAERRGREVAAAGRVRLGDVEHRRRIDVQRGRPRSASPRAP